MFLRIKTGWGEVLLRRTPSPVTEEWEFPYGKLPLWLRRTPISLTEEVEFAVVFAIWGQLMMHQTRQHLLQLEEEPLAGGVTIGEHPKINGQLRIDN